LVYWKKKIKKIIAAQKPVSGQLMKVYFATGGARDRTDPLQKPESLCLSEWSVKAFPKGMILTGLMDKNDYIHKVSGG